MPSQAARARVTGPKCCYPRRLQRCAVVQSQPLILPTKQALEPSTLQGPALCRVMAHRQPPGLVLKHPSSRSINPPSAHPQPRWKLEYSRGACELAFSLLDKTSSAASITFLNLIVALLCTP